MDRYYSFSSYLRKVFGKRVFRVTVDAGFTCPNRDGTKGSGGCIYCYSGSNYDPEKRKKSIEEQIKEGIERVRRRYKATAFLVYFQAFTNTYAPLDHLRKVYDTVKKFPEVVGIIIGTRPDCVSKDILNLINSYTDKYLVWIEYGLESSHYRSLRWMKRGHGISDFVNAVLMTKEFPKINICAHTILGIPIEDRNDILETADFIASLKLDGVKIHPLHIIKDTELEKIYLEERFHILTLEEYSELVVEFIERLPPKTVIQRITGEVSEDLLVAPTWCSHKEKQNVIKAIREEFERRDTSQGRKCRFNCLDL